MDRFKNYLFVLVGSFDLDTVDVVLILSDYVSLLLLLYRHTHRLCFVAFFVVFLAYVFCSIVSSVQL